MYKYIAVVHAMFVIDPSWMKIQTKNIHFILTYSVLSDIHKLIIQYVQLQEKVIVMFAISCFSTELVISCDPIFIKYHPVSTNIKFLSWQNSNNL